LIDISIDESEDEANTNCVSSDVGTPNNYHSSVLQSGIKNDESERGTKYEVIFYVATINNNNNTSQHHNAEKKASIEEAKHEEMKY
jgi:hypothetical protein